MNTTYRPYEKTNNNFKLKDVIKTYRGEAEQDWTVPQETELVSSGDFLAEFHECHKGCRECREMYNNRFEELRKDNYGR